MGLRIRILTIVFVLMFLGLTLRLSFWQIVKGRGLSEEARSQHSSQTIMTAPRGNILSGDGSFWVLRGNAWLVTANPKLFRGKTHQVASELAPLLVDDPKDSALLAGEEQRLTELVSKNVSWVPLKQKVTDETKKNVEALKIEGIGFESQETRFYPEASAAAQLLGFVGKDESGNSVGYFGLEGYYNLALGGKAGFSKGEVDAKGNPILLTGSNQAPPVPGVDLVTSVDKRIQILAEEKLEEGINKYGAKGGSVIIMDPFSGSILAMAGSPSFDPAKYQDYGDTFFKNPVISDTFEPGSIFKPVVMAAALDAKVVTPDAQCDICGGPLKIDKYLIKTWNNVYHPQISMTDVIVDSDNVGMSFVGQKMGADAISDYLGKFGFGSLTGIDLQGEASPKLRKKSAWSDVDVVTASFGQGVAVTGIQMLRAISVIANGGYLVTPHVVTTIQGDGWQEVVKVAPPVRIISQTSASEATQMMVEAASRGEAKWTRIPGFDVAGKTGTAQIPIEGHYDSTNTNHSFVGFAPAIRPKFVMLVTLSSPVSSPWAAETAAPLWYSIARELFPYLGVSPHP